MATLSGISVPADFYEKFVELSYECFEKQTPNPKEDSKTLIKSYLPATWAKRLLAKLDS